MTGSLLAWLEEVTTDQYVWYVKRLSGNDTLANGSHQAGPYFPKSILFKIFPQLNKCELKNPDIKFDLAIDSHPDYREIRAVWYNNKFHGNSKGGRDETRLTGFGGQSSALLDKESTGAITVFAFSREKITNSRICKVWVCRHGIEEDLIEERIGPVEPGIWRVWPESFLEEEADYNEREVREARSGKYLSEKDIPKEWLLKFPSGNDIVGLSVKLVPSHGLTPDERLIRRRECEFEIFKLLENLFELPSIKLGFGTLDQFIQKAHTILQRRKSRSGRSLELQTKYIFLEEGLIEGIHFSHQPESETGKRPDYLFPSERCYKNQQFSSNKLKMLAVKTTCKDRWRQILNEANRIETKHLLTLQEGVSESQFKEMREASVELVVPEQIRKSFPKSVQPHLKNLGSFIADVRLLVY